MNSSLGLEGSFAAFGVFQLRLLPPTEATVSPTRENLIFPDVVLTLAVSDT
jgi:hypothetical protein